MTKYITLRTMFIIRIIIIIVVVVVIIIVIVVIVVVVIIIMIIIIIIISLFQWPRGLRHVVFDRSNTGIAVLNPARGMDVFLRFSVLCRAVQVEALRRADPPSKES
jgi:hypothetical protein